MHIDAIPRGLVLDREVDSTPEYAGSLGIHKGELRECEPDPEMLQ